MDQIPGVEIQPTTDENNYWETLFAIIGKVDHWEEHDYPTEWEEEQPDGTKIEMVIYPAPFIWKLNYPDTPTVKVAIQPDYKNDDWQVVLDMDNGYEFITNDHTNADDAFKITRETMLKVNQIIEKVEQANTRPIVENIWSAMYPETREDWMQRLNADESNAIDKLRNEINELLIGMVISAAGIMRLRNKSIIGTIIHLTESLDPVAEFASIIEDIPDFSIYNRQQDYLAAYTKLAETLDTPRATA
jgi:hypothetical protein